jgi:hypothetical protein
MDSVSSQQQLIDIYVDLSPYQKFSYALNAPESQIQYPRRFQQFLDFLQIKGPTIGENVNTLYNLIEKMEPGGWKLSC